APDGEPSLLVRLLTGIPLLPAPPLTPVVPLAVALFRIALLGVGALAPLLPRRPLPRGAPPPRVWTRLLRQPAGLRQRSAEQEVDLRVGGAQLLPRPTGQCLVDRGVEPQQHLLALPRPVGAPGSVGGLGLGRV